MATLASIKLSEVLTKEQIASVNGGTPLSDERRQELTEALQESHRGCWRHLTEFEVRERNQWSLENTVVSVITLDWQTCVDRLGLVHVEDEIEYQRDEEGEVLTNEKGEPLKGNVLEAAHDFAVIVSREGLKDHNGKPIPKSKGKKREKFIRTKQPTNRPLNMANCESLRKRFPFFAFNGEPTIKDALGNGQSEQHRLTQKAIDILEGRTEPNDQSTVTLSVEGIHPDASETIDTGKPNTGKDLMASDPRILPESLIRTFKGFHGIVPGEKPKDVIGQRTRIAGILESSAKLALLRFAGKNVNASLGDGYQATMAAHQLVTEILTDYDELASMVFATFEELEHRAKPCSPAEFLTGLVLYALREADPIEYTVPKKGEQGGFNNPPNLSLDPEQFLPILADLADCNREGPLAGWASAMNSAGKLDKTTKFYHVLKAIIGYFEGSPYIGKEGKLPVNVPKQASKDYLALGGADIGNPSESEEE